MAVGGRSFEGRRGATLSRWLDPVEMRVGCIEVRDGDMGSESAMVGKFRTVNGAGVRGGQRMADWIAGLARA